MGRQQSGGPTWFINIREASKTCVHLNHSLEIEKWFNMFKADRDAANS